MTPPEDLTTAPVAADPSTLEQTVGGAQAPKTVRGEATRARILDAALELFRQRGYDNATMRAVADRAGVSLGNAYYYFRSKEHLIQAFYGRTHEEHLMASRPLLAEPGSLRDRLLAVMRTKLDTIESYHRFAGILFKTAADPASPLNPFSAESGPVRHQATALFEEVVNGSTTRIPTDLRTELPELLWMYHMGVILYWIYDTSPGRAKSYRLVDRTVRLIDRLVALARLPLMTPVRKSVLGMVREAIGDRG